MLFVNYQGDGLFQTFIVDYLKIKIDPSSGLKDNPA